MTATSARVRPLLLLAAGLLAGCARPKPPLVPTPPPEVVVVLPETKLVTRYEDFTGRTRASKAVDIKTQVTAELRAVSFADGADVAAGQELFTLDPTVFQADVDRALAALKQAEAVSVEATKEYQLNKNAPAGVSRLDVVKSEGAMRVAEAGVTVAQKQLEVAKNYLDYTHIKAAFAGRIGRRLVDPGNRVKQDETVLARLLQIDPMDVDFDVDDRTLLQLYDQLMVGPTAAAAGGGWRMIGTGRRTIEQKVLVGRPDRDDFTLEGTVTFIDNQLNAATSTIQLRAEVANPTGELVPGLFVRVRIPVGEPRVEVLVPEEAIGTDQQLKFVFVVNGESKVEYRKVRLGQQEGGRRVVEPIPGDPSSGVGPTDRVIVEGLQRARAGAAVTVRPAKAAK